MSDDEHKPIPGLPDAWRPPARVRFEKAWNEHEQHEELVKRQSERDGDGNPAWEPAKKITDDEWVEI